MPTPLRASTLARRPTTSPDEAASVALGARVLALRKARRLSAGALAERAQIGSRPHLTHLEHGRIDPRLGTVRRLSAALGVSICELVEETPDRPALVARVLALPEAALGDLARLVSMVERAHASEPAAPEARAARARAQRRRSRLR